MGELPTERLLVAKLGYQRVESRTSIQNHATVRLSSTTVAERMQLMTVRGDASSFPKWSLVGFISPIKRDDAQQLSTPDPGRMPFKVPK